MADRANTHLSEQIEAAFAWWREAGVDCTFGDAPTDWLAEAAPPANTKPHPRAGVDLARPGGSTVDARGSRPPEGQFILSGRPAGQPKGGDAESAKPPALPIDAATLPQDLAAFCDWWLSEPKLDNGRTAGRVPPRGLAGAELMVVVPEPEREDDAHLLSGPQGRLLDAMLAAMGLAPDRVYLASALPRHTPMADWGAAAAQGIGTILRHHIHLAAPQRLLVLGGNALSLLGNDLPNSGQILFQLNHENASIPSMGATDLGVLLVRPRAKARIWQQWLDWTGIGTT
jgi:DNA polymerase